MGVSGNSVVFSEELRKWKKMLQKELRNIKAFGHSPRQTPAKPGTKYFRQKMRKTSTMDYALKFLIVLWSIFDCRCFAHFPKNPNWTKTEASGLFPALLFLQLFIIYHCGPKILTMGRLFEISLLDNFRAIKTHDFPSIKIKDLARKSFETWAISSWRRGNLDRRKMHSLLCSGFCQSSPNEFH